jgi:Ca-activated chloride channel homolog
MVMVALALLMSLLAAGRAGAQPAARQFTEGTLLWRTAQQQTPTPAPVLETDVKMRVTGMIVRATVHQAFTNPSGEWAEGLYVFPLPEDAAVDHLRMWVGDRVIEGVIREREVAKAEYAQARQQGQRASLVEQQRPNVFRTSVANIPPAASITIEIEYQQTARYDAGQFRLRFPMVVGPRYHPGGPQAGVTADEGADAERQARGPGDEDVEASPIATPIPAPSPGPINPVRLSVELDPGIPLAAVESPYHAIRTTRTHGGRYEIALADEVVPADRDFELAWRPVTAAAPAAAFLVESGGDHVYALLMVMPPSPAVERLRVPREVTFILDQSGSMAGASIDQAKAALALALGRLTSNDAFNVIRFNDRTDSLFLGPQPATAANVGLAERYVTGIRATGGTEMQPALERALDGSQDPGRLRQVIFLTDGGVSNEARLFEVIRERLGDRRLFTIGIGSAPNSHFMSEAARVGRGTFTYIGSPDEVQSKMLALFRKIEAPALADLELVLAGAADAEILPSPIPDLYVGEPIVVALRARTLPAHVVVRGRLGASAWQREVSVHAAVEGAGLSVHWARKKIAALLDQRRTGRGDDDVRRAVIGIALAHHLVSAHTSLIAVDVTPVRPADAALSILPLATSAPHGWDHAALAGAGQGATDAPLHLALGMAALLAAAAIALHLRGTPVVVVRRRHERDPRSGRAWPRRS